MAKSKNSESGLKVVVSNRKARHDYSISDSLEAGMVLTGPEVKSLRAGRANLRDAFCTISAGEVFLRNTHIAPYYEASYNNADPMRPRKLLLHRREIARLEKSTQQKGFTLVPLRIYFKNGRAKVEIGLARGKKQYDKRADIAERDTKRRLQRIKADLSR